MDWRAVERFISMGQAFLPVNYEGQGDVVSILFKNGQEEKLSMSADSFLKQLLMYYGTSISASRQRYGYFLGKKQLVPIPLSYGATIVPYHTREAIGRQTRTGWFVASEINGFKKLDQHQTILTLSEHGVTVFHSKKFCFEQLKNARWIEFCFQELHRTDQKGWNFFRDMRGIYENV